MQEEKLKRYVEKFNSQDEELIRQSISNAQAYDWLRENIPFLDCPDGEIEETYYFRWWVYRKHVKNTPEGHIITEFLPEVYWAGKYNSINCAVGHHLYEGRWLRNGNTCMEENIRFWLKGSGDVRSYSTWIADAVYQYCLVKGNFEIAVELLPELKGNYAQWEKEHQHRSGLFWSIDDRDAMEYSISGNGLRPTLNSYLYADASAIARIAEMAGDPSSQIYEKKAAGIKKLMQEKLWDEKDEFFKVMPLESREGIVRDWNFASVDEAHNVREEIGFIPWYFHLPDPGFEAAWKQIKDKEGFLAPYGPTTAEKRHPRYQYKQEDHECLWNGPSWPFATTQTLTAMANLLKDYHQDYVTEEDFFHLFQAYTHAHYRKKEDGEKVNWLDENLDPDTGEWLSRKILEDWGWKAEKGGYERGKDYNHSAYADLIISKIFGVEPQENGKLQIRPMLPEKWDYCSLQNIRCQGKNINILYDKSGEVYQQGKGYQIWIDGTCVHRSEKPENIQL